MTIKMNERLYTLWFCLVEKMGCGKVTTFWNESHFPLFSIMRIVEIQLADICRFCASLFNNHLSLFLSVVTYMLFTTFSCLSLAVTSLGFVVV